MRDLLGAHMSIAGGLDRALWRGRDVGCSVVQIFLKNQRQWRARPYTAEDIRSFRAAWRESGLRAVFAHATYLINLAAPAAAEWKRAVSAFHDELERAEALGLPFVIIHPGSHKGAGPEAGIRRKGAERCIAPRVGESYPDYKKRLFAVERDWQREVDEARRTGKTATG